MQRELVKEISKKELELKNHPIYSSIGSINELQIFMQAHVFAVFDFMSLTKSLQNEFAPSCEIWLPPKESEIARFINEIILSEESDELPSGGHASHFELYCNAMKEVGANTETIDEFIGILSSGGLAKAMSLDSLPSYARNFMLSTFNFIASKKAHIVAAAFCFGREHIIPHMFQSLLDKFQVSQNQAPMFHYYLKRHIELDGDSHGPMALKMLDILCGDDEQKWLEVKQATLSAMNARIKLWDDLLLEINQSKSSPVSSPV